MEIILRKFEEIGDVFLKWYVEPEYHKNYGNYIGEKWKGALLFFTNYVFERQGRPPDWKEITKYVLEEKLNGIKNIENVDIKKLEDEIWKGFKKEWKNIKVTDDKSNERKIDIENNKGFNIALNPLAVTGTRYTDKKGEQEHSTTKSLIRFVAKRLKEYEYDIIYFAQTKLRDRKIKEAYEELCPKCENSKNKGRGIDSDKEGINGVGKKIITMFLRDIFVLSQIKPDNISLRERAYLQPIDIWVKRCCKYLHAFENGTTDIKESYEEFILKICKKYGDVNPEGVNMGMWLFSSQIIGNHYELANIFRDKKTEKDVVKEINKKVEEYINWLKCGQNFLGKMEWQK